MCFWIASGTSQPPSHHQLHVVSTCSSCITQQVSRAFATLYSPSTACFPPRLSQLPKCQRFPGMGVVQPNQGSLSYSSCRGLVFLFQPLKPRPKKERPDIAVLLKELEAAEDDLPPSAATFDESSDFAGNRPQRKRSQRAAFRGDGPEGLLASPPSSGPTDKDLAAKCSHKAGSTSVRSLTGPGASGECAVISMTTTYRWFTFMSLVFLGNLRVNNDAFGDVVGGYSLESPVYLCK